MKRTLIASILGIAASVVSSYGQGQIQFVTYASSAVYAPVVWGAGSGHSGAVVGGDNLTATLYYGIGSGLSFAQLSAIPSSATQVGVLYPGSIVGGNATLPVFTAGSAVTFAIVVTGNGFASTSTSTWTEPSGVVVAQGLPTNPFTFATLDAAYPGGIQVFSTAPVPEPSTLVLAGLGGAALLALRRRQ
jgi:hypothetical protein